MSEYEELYQEILLDHNKNPRNFGRLPLATCSAEGYNPLCGDHIKLYLTVENEVIADVRFEGSGCAISRASASMLGEAIKGKSKGEALALFATFRDLITTEEGGKSLSESELGDLIAFHGVRAYPVRIKCAVLAWHALQAALNGESVAVMTENSHDHHTLKVAK